MADLEEQAASGRKSKLVLDALEDAFRVLREDCFNTFAGSDIHDHKGHQTCRLYLKVAEDLHERFRVAIINGDAASKELIRLNSKKEET